MTKRCSKNIIPDSITGMIFAAEGIRDTVVLLNGPMGCRFYHSTTSQFLSIRPILYLPSENGEKVPVDYNYLNSWFFRQPRVPCTYLDGYDYVYGTSEKIREGLAYLKSHVDFGMLVIVNSPGASLIGDHLEELANEVLLDFPCAVLESPGYSQDYMMGYEEATLGLLEQVLFQAGQPSQASPSRRIQANQPCRPASAGKMCRKTVNVLGLSIWNRYFEGDKAELERVLGLCGIGVNCFLCAGCSLEDIQNLPQADLNLVVNPQMGAQCAQALHRQYGMEAYVCPSPPIGFAATEQMCRGLCRKLGTDGAALEEDSEKARAAAWYRINDIYQMCGLPRGVSFAVEGSCCEVYAYSCFFMEYLGMLPDCLAVTGMEAPSIREQLDRLAGRYHAQEALEKDILDTHAELVFANANTIAALKTTGRVFCGIEISLPGMGYTDIIPKTHWGVQGAMFLTEQVLNGLMSKL